MVTHNQNQLKRIKTVYCLRMYNKIYKRFCKIDKKNRF